MFYFKAISHMTVLSTGFNRGFHVFKITMIFWKQNIVLHNKPTAIATSSNVVMWVAQTYLNPLTTAGADRQLLELESCSNPQWIQKVF